VLFSLAFLYFWREKKYFFSALALSLSVLCDYGSLFLLPAFGLALLVSNDYKALNIKIFKSFFLGCIIPLLLWIYYHTLCFGKPWYIANRFQNPVFQDVKTVENQLWGVIALFPNFTTMKNLLWGSTRGILQTQPWVLIALILQIKLIFKNNLRSFSNYFAIFSFAFLFYMNASFGGWHGGASPGARYMSVAFALIAFSIWENWIYFAYREKLILWIALGWSLIFYAHVMSTSILMTGYPILEEAFHWVWTTHRFPGAIIKTITILFLFFSHLILFYLTRQSELKSRAFELPSNKHQPN
jgi:hypothetical protein